jgi:glycosyltransferase involved in cell wall biosynthesis
MMQVVSYLPAWLLKRLPVRLARNCALALRNQTSQADEAHPVESKNIKHHSIAEIATSTHTPARQLLVDVSVIYQNDARTGIQRAVRSLLLQLLSTPPSGCTVCPVFATRHHGYCYADRSFLEKQERTQPTTRNPGVEKVQVHNEDVFLALDLAAHLLPRHQAQVLSWKRFGVKVHVVVYDLLPLQRPEWFNPKTTRNFKRWVAWLAVYADSAVCISDAVKTDLQAWLNTHYGLSPTALPATNFVLGANINASAPSDGLPATAEFLLTRLRNTPTVLMVGTLEPRKGYDQALSAFELLWQHAGKAPLLVVVGRPGWKTEALQKLLRSHPQVGKRLFWLEDVSDEFLEQLYATCKGVLVASRAEGFGLPLIEAALHKKPILARKLAVFKELDISGLTYFSGDAPQDLATALSNWLNTVPMPVMTSSGSAAPSALPTWQLSASQLLQALGFQSLNSDLTKNRSNSSRAGAPA